MLCIDPNQRTLPEEVADALVKSPTIAFIGSGPSIGAYGTWKTALVEIASTANAAPPSLPEMPNFEEFLEGADHIRRQNESRYLEAVHRHFGTPHNATDLLYLALLQMPFRAYVTLNFDCSLREILRTLGNPLPVYSFPDIDISHLDMGGVFHIHGMAQANGPYLDFIVMCSATFQRAYQKPGLVRAFLLHLFITHTVFFFGCSLSELHLQDVMADAMQEQVDREHYKRLSRVVPEVPPRHYIFLAQDEVDARAVSPAEIDVVTRARDADYRGKGVIPVWYSRHGDNHHALIAALRQAPHAPAQPSPLPSSRMLQPEVAPSVD